MATNRGAPTVLPTSTSRRPGTSTSGRPRPRGRSTTRTTKPFFETSPRRPGLNSTANAAAAAGRSFGSFFFGSVDAAAADAAVSVFRVETTTSNPRRPSREATDDVQATPGVDLLESLSSRFEDAKIDVEQSRGVKIDAEQSRGESRGTPTPASASSGESPPRAPPRPYPAFEPEKARGDASDPEGHRVVTRADAIKSVAAARSALVDPGKDGVSASLAALMTGLNALGRSVEMRMDRVEAALQAQERRLRRIEAAVTDTSDRGKA